MFAADAIGKCSFRIGEEVGNGELDKHVAQHIANSGVACASPDRLNMRSSRAKVDRAKVEAGAVHDGVAVATAGAAGAAAGVATVAGTAVVEVATAAPVILPVIQVDPKGAVEVTTASVAVGVAAAEVVIIRSPAAVDTAGGGGTGERSASRRRAILCPGALGAQVLATKRVSAHQTRQYW